MKHRLSRILARPSIGRWAAPLRTLWQIGGWRPARIPLDAARSILVIRPDKIGDVILTGPFLRGLRRAARNARIALVVQTANHELVEHCPYVDAVYSLNFAGHSNGDRVRLRLAALRKRLSRLPLCGFDIVLLPRRDADWYDSRIIGHLFAGRGALVIHRDVLVKSSSDSPPDPPVAFNVYSNPEIEHEVLHNLRFLRWCGAKEATDSRLEFWFSNMDRHFAANILTAGRKYVSFGTGAGHSARCWPIDRFAAIDSWMRDRYGLVPVLLGAAGDPGFDGSLNLIGRTTLRQAAAVIERCSLFVGNDSGLKHIAAAVGVPVVEVSGFRIGGDSNHPNSPLRFHAWGVPQRVVQPSAGPGALVIEEVTVDAVRIACAECLLESA